MNRKIIFRAKRIDNGEWIYGVPLFDWAPCSFGCENLHKGELITFIGWEDCCHEYDEIEVDPATVGQHTGLEDKNGIMIYEGDIIRIYLPIMGCNPIVQVSEIYFDNGCFCVNWGWNYRTHNRIRIDSFIPKTFSEVIGNVHDTPELLEVRNDGLQ